MIMGTNRTTTPYNTTNIQMQDITSIKSRLNEELFSSTQESCLTLCRVYDLTKKGKERVYILCACIYPKADPQPTIHLIKIPEKSTETCKKKTSLLLRDIKTIDCAPDKRSTTKTNARAEKERGIDIIHVDREYSFACVTNEEKQEFLITLRKVTAHYLKDSKQKPKFINFESDDQLIVNPKDVEDMSRKTLQMEPSDAITQQEEDDLTSLMSEYDFAIKDAERFVEMLQQRLTDLDIANVETVMASEKGAVQLMNMLDKAVDEITKTDTRLSLYEKKLSSVADAVKIMSRKDSLIQIETSNVLKLTEALDNLLSMQDFPDEYIHLLQNNDLTNDDSRTMCTQAANHLNQALSVQLQPGMEKMVAVRQKRELLEQTQKSFSLRVKNFLSNKFLYCASEYGERFQIGANELPRHTEKIAKQLLPYSPLCQWLKVADQQHFKDVCQAYISHIRPIYSHELQGFIESARLGVQRGLPSASEKKIGSVTSLTARNQQKQILQTQTSTGSSGSSGPVDYDPFSLRNTPKEYRQRCDKIFERVLSQIGPVIREEQWFCVNFFKFLEEETISTDNAPESTESIENFSSTGLKQMLSDLFEPLDAELKSLISYIRSVEPYIVLYLFVRMSEYTIAVQNFGAFLNKLFAGNLILLKRDVDSYISDVCSRINDYRPSKSRRVGILPFVTYFAEFTEEAETVFDKSQRAVDLHRVYKNLVAAIFRGIESCAMSAGDGKTPPSMVRLENYHQMQHIIGINKLSVLDNEKQEARKNYGTAKDEYEREYCGFPFEKLHVNFSENFFDRVDELRKRLTKDEDVQYHNDFGVIELRRLVREHPPKEVHNCLTGISIQMIFSRVFSQVKKGLEILYRKVEKHLSENSSLMQAIWHDIQSLVLEEHERMTKLIAQCYPNSNIQLDFTVDNLLSFFAEIAHSN
ncbi:unnamed protein product [Didymodactylos carnosus]|uniref:Exocyst complex component Sec3 PIP2-binding N-terminal domain-containing protein n=1 Tax=Didymodactylos carnosus TaxID=1234261 RepID=A0A8S2GWS3_9BILA|nr:unnamed protein product [Didymodactylos carnosus]CAF3571157.1 unnamed protein product [Didymodactylos carnosus]